MDLKSYEMQVIRILTSGTLPPEQSETIIREGRIDNYEFTGCGYFLYLSHPSLPQARAVCDTPLLTGHSDKEDCGFVIFIEKGQLVLECYTYDDAGLSDSFREKDVQIKTVT